MIYTTKDKLKSRQIDTMILSLEDFTYDRILLLNTAFRNATVLLPASADKIDMLTRFDASRGPYELSVTTRNIAISSRSEDVVLFSEQEKLLSKRIGSIKRKVREIDDSEAILTFYNLTNTKYYTRGRQSDIVSRINELEVKMTARPDYLTVLPFVVSLKLDLGTIFGLKLTQNAIVEKDKKDIDPLLQNLK